LCSSEDRRCFFTQTVVGSPTAPARSLRSNAQLGGVHGCGSSCGAEQTSEVSNRPPPPPPPMSRVNAMARAGRASLTESHLAPAAAAATAAAAGHGAGGSGSGALSGAYPGARYTGSGAVRSGSGLVQALQRWTGLGGGTTGAVMPSRPASVAATSPGALPSTSHFLTSSSGVTRSASFRVPPPTPPSLLPATSDMGSVARPPSHHTLHGEAALDRGTHSTIATRIPVPRRMVSGGTTVDAASGAATTATELPAPSSRRPPSAGVRAASASGTARAVRASAPPLSSHTTVASSGGGVLGRKPSAGAGHMSLDRATPEAGSQHSMQPARTAAPTAQATTGASWSTAGSSTHATLQKPPSFSGAGYAPRDPAPSQPHLTGDAPTAHASSSSASGGSGVYSGMFTSSRAAAVSAAADSIKRTMSGKGSWLGADGTGAPATEVGGAPSAASRPLPTSRSFYSTSDGTAGVPTYTPMSNAAAASGSASTDVASQAHKLVGAGGGSRYGGFTSDYDRDLYAPPPATAAAAHARSTGTAAVPATASHVGVRGNTTASTHASGRVVETNARSSGFGSAAGASYTHIRAPAAAGSDSDDDGYGEDDLAEYADDAPAGRSFGSASRGGGASSSSVTDYRREGSTAGAIAGGSGSGSGGGWRSAAPVPVDRVRGLVGLQNLGNTW